MEARPHDPIQHGIGDGDDRHALVMRHEGAHHSDRLAVRNPGRREVQRLVEAKPPARADHRKPGQVAYGRLRIDHGRQGGGIGRHHGVGAQAALQTQPWYAEVRILIGVFDVADVVGGFRQPPGYAAFGAEIDLALHDLLVRLLQQAASRRAHDQGRHQILEHRSGPGHQRGATLDGGDGAAKPKPLTRRDIALGNRHEDGQPRLGRQKIVAVVVEHCPVNEISD